MFEEVLAIKLGEMRDDRNALKERVIQLEKERDEAKALAEEACRRYNDSLRCMTCAFCGETYPPTTPTAGAKVLEEHVKICKAHPMRLVEKELIEARACNAEMRSLIEDIRNRIAQHGWGICGTYRISQARLYEDDHRKMERALSTDCGKPILDRLERYRKALILCDRFFSGCGAVIRSDCTQAIYSALKD